MQFVESLNILVQLLKEIEASVNSTQFAKSEPLLSSTEKSYAWSKTLIASKGVHGVPEPWEVRKNPLVAHIYGGQKTMSSVIPQVLTTFLFPLRYGLSLAWN